MIREFKGIEDDVGSGGSADGDSFVDDLHLFAF
jgi:hypothetical protein